MPNVARAIAPKRILTQPAGSCTNLRLVTLLAPQSIADYWQAHAAPCTCNIYIYICIHMFMFMCMYTCPCRRKTRTKHNVTSIVVLWHAFVEHAIAH